MSAEANPTFALRPKAQVIFDYLNANGEQSSQALADAIDQPYTTQRNHLIWLEQEGLIKRRKKGRDVFWSIRQIGEYTQHHVPSEFKVYWPPLDQELTVPEIIIECQNKNNQGAATTQLLYQLLADMTRLALEYYDGEDSSINPLGEKCRNLETQLRSLQKRLPLLIQMVDSILLQPNFFAPVEFVRNLIEDNPNFPVDKMRQCVMMGDETWTKDQLMDMHLNKAMWLEALFLYTFNKPLNDEQIMLILPGLVDKREDLHEVMRTLKHPDWEEGEPDFQMFKKTRNGDWIYDQMSLPRIKKNEYVYRTAKLLQQSKIVPAVLGRGIICQDL
jgi:hypothetical protein